MKKKKLERPVFIASMLKLKNFSKFRETPRVSLLLLAMRFTVTSLMSILLKDMLKNS